MESMAVYLIQQKREITQLKALRHSPNCTVCENNLLIKSSSKRTSDYLFSVEEKLHSNALCYRVIVGKNPLPIWPEFVRGPKSLITSSRT